MSAPKLTAWQRRASKVSGLRAEYLTRSKFGFRRKAGMPFFVPANRERHAWPVGIGLSGGLEGGRQAGAAMALGMLKFYGHLSESGRAPAPESLNLWWVINALSARRDVARSRAAPEVRAMAADPLACVGEWLAAEAQFAEFCRELERWLVVAAEGLAPRLEAISDAEVVLLAEAGLGYDEVAASQPFALARNRAKRPRATKGKGGES